jgi:uroporphyrinogen-III synthase
MSGKIVVTRTLVQGKSFADAILSNIDSVHGDDFLFEPILQIKKNDDVMLPYLGNYTAVLVTSAHGCDVIPHRSEGFSPQFYCVGTATAARLIEKGYKPGIVMQSAKDLLDAVNARHAGSREDFLYLKGRDVSVDIKTSLELVQHRVEECEVYSAELSQCFSKVFLIMLMERKVGIITFFSRRTARHFATMVDDMGISNAIAGIQVLCISDAVVECLHSNFIESSVVSPTPDMSGMVRAIEDMLIANS